MTHGQLIVWELLVGRHGCGSAAIMYIPVIGSLRPPGYPYDSLFFSPYTDTENVTVGLSCFML